MKKAILNTAIAAMLLLCTAPALRAQELKVAGNVVNLTTTGNVTGNGITSAAGSVHYNHTTNTLTLNNANISVSGDNEGITSEIPGLTISLIGNNQVVNTGSWNAIKLEKSATINGSGSLRAQVTNGYNGIKIISATLTISGGCTVIAIGKTGIGGHEGHEQLVIDNSTVKATGSEWGSIRWLGSLTLNGVTITQPVGAAFNSTLRGVALNGEVVKDEVVIMPPTVPYDLYIAGTWVTSANAADILGDGKVSYDHSTTTLTLNGATITATGINIGIFSSVEGLKIVLQGTNKVETNASAIVHFKPLTIQGTGTLEATSSANVSAIYAYQTSLTIKDGCTVIAKGGKYGIMGNNGNTEILTINNSTVKATGTNDGSIVDFNSLVLEGCAITVPSGAAFDATQPRKGVYTNGTLVTGEVVITPTGAGLQTTEAAAAARLYPNPVGDLLTIETDETIEALQLFDLAGKLLLSQTPQSKTHTLDVSALQSGVYMLKIRTKNGSKTVKVVK